MPFFLRVFTTAMDTLLRFVNVIFKKKKFDPFDDTPGPTDRWVTKIPIKSSMETDIAAQAIELNFTVFDSGIEIFNLIDTFF